MINIGDSMTVAEKIGEYLKSIRDFNKRNFSETKITTGYNKDGEKLLYVRASKFEQNTVGGNYSNDCNYYAFDMNGNYVGCVKINVLDPDQVEMEYYANENYKNRGNITLLAREVIREIFEEKIFDNLRFRNDQRLTKIETIMVAINLDNPASLAVAKKLGFDESQYLRIEDYYKQQKKPLEKN